MPLSNKRGTRRTGRHVASLGLLANGSSGPWDIAIDQTTSGAKRWFAQIEGPSLSLRFELASLDVLDRSLDLLGRGGDKSNGNTASGAGDTAVLTNSKVVRVALRRDDEFLDRYFLTMESKDQFAVQLTLVGEDRDHLMFALRQVKEDLVA